MWPILVLLKVANLQTSYHLGQEELVAEHKPTSCFLHKETVLWKKCQQCAQWFNQQCAQWFSCKHLISSWSSNTGSSDSRDPQTTLSAALTSAVSRELRVSEPTLPSVHVPFLFQSCLLSFLSLLLFLLLVFLGSLPNKWRSHESQCQPQPLGMC